jgi:Icc-related predicted phosphoesterase
MVLSDFHGAAHVLDGVGEVITDISPDVVTFSGDIVKGYKRGDEWLAAREEDRAPQMTEDIKAEEKEDLHFYNLFFSFLDQLSVPVFVVPGNMDAPESRFLAASPQSKVVHKTLVREPVRITGCGGQITEDKKENTFVLQYPRENVIDSMESLSTEEIDIIITHSPPVSSVSFEDGQEKGSLVVNDLIDLLRPQYLFCGHAHKSQGAVWIKTTLTVNPGALKYGNYAVVEGDTVEFGRL